MNFGFFDDILYVSIFYVQNVNLKDNTMFHIILLESSDDRKTILDYLIGSNYQCQVIGYSILCLATDINNHKVLFDYMKSKLNRAGQIITINNFNGSLSDYVSPKQPISLR